MQHRKCKKNEHTGHLNPTQASSRFHWEKSPRGFTPGGRQGTCSRGGDKSGDPQPRSNDRFMRTALFSYFTYMLTGNVALRRWFWPEAVCMCM